MNLTDDQRQAIGNGQTVPVLIDGLPCVVIRSDVFERVYHDTGDWSHDELRQALARASSENGWDEPDMDAYDRLVP